MTLDPVCRMKVDARSRARRMKPLAIALAAAVAGFALAVAAQTPAEPPRAGHEVAPETRWHHDMGSVMGELSEAIDRMGEQMRQAPGPDMAARMKELSGMLDKMSGLQARAAHGPDEEAQLATLRQRLHALTATDKASPSALSVDERMARIEAQLQALDAQMERARAARDSGERSRLLGEHARGLRRTIAELREIDRPFSRQMRAMMGGGAHGMSAEKMMLLHDLMSRRVSLMERAMEQLMEQSMSEADAGRK